MLHYGFFKSYESYKCRRLTPRPLPYGGPFERCGRVSAKLVADANIDLDEGTCSLDLTLEAADYFNLKPIDARAIVREVGSAVATWREAAAEVGARVQEIERMASAFEHDDLARARAL